MEQCESSRGGRTDGMGVGASRVQSSRVNESLTSEVGEGIKGVVKEERV